MESLINMNRRILLISSKIKQDFPELIHFLDEMPITIPNENHPEINLALLTTYYQSLISLKEKYEKQLILKQNQHD